MKFFYNLSQLFLFVVAVVVMSTMGIDHHHWQFWTLLIVMLLVQLLSTIQAKRQLISFIDWDGVIIEDREVSRSSINEQPSNDQR